MGPALRAGPPRRTCQARQAAQSSREGTGSPPLPDGPAPQWRLFRNGRGLRSSRPSNATATEYLVFTADAGADRPSKLRRQPTRCRSDRLGDLTIHRAARHPEHSTERGASGIKKRGPGTGLRVPLQRRGVAPESRPRKRTRTAPATRTHGLHRASASAPRPRSRGRARSEAAIGLDPRESLLTRLRLQRAAS
jgi:hypothetical protein